MADLYDKLTRFEEYYHYLESSFVDITRIIPLENEPDTFSPRLYEILQSTCSQVDGILKLMHGRYISTCEKSAATMYEALNREGVISSRVLAPKNHSDWKEIRPFLCDFKCIFLDNDVDPHEDVTPNGMPKWWKAYNESKHGLPEGYKAGNIENTYLALAGLYVLHVMMRKHLRDASDFLKRDYWVTGNPIPRVSNRMRTVEPAIIEPPSEIFMPKIQFP